MRELLDCHVTSVTASSLRDRRALCFRRPARAVLAGDHTGQPPCPYWTLIQAHSVAIKTKSPPSRGELFVFSESTLIEPAFASTLQINGIGYFRHFLPPVTLLAVNQKRKHRAGLVQRCRTVQRPDFLLGIHVAFHVETDFSFLLRIDKDDFKGGVTG